MKRTLLVTSLLVLMCTPLFAATVFIEATQDNTLYESPTGRLSNGAGEHFFVGLTNEALKRRAVIAFKDLGVIPRDATITSVVLHLQLSKESSGPTVIELNRLTADWGEGTSDATDNEGQGANSEPDDATWIHSFWSTFQWGLPGGDFNPSPSAQLAVGTAGSYMFGSTTGMVSDVQRWLDHPNDNFGWILIGNESAKSARRFDSRDHSNPNRRPFLEVSYSTTGTSSDYTGPWFDPALDGEGYLVYQTTAGWLIYYFGYSADENFLWLTSDLVKLDQLVMGVPFEMPMVIGKPGTFDNPTPSTELTPYGTLSVTIYDCGSGQFILDGLDGKKTSNVIKLIGVDGTSCE